MIENAIRKQNADTTPLKISTSDLHEVDFQGKKIIQKGSLIGEKLFKIIADFSSDWIYWIDPDNTISFVSPSCKFITGFNPDEMQNETSFWKKIIHPHNHSNFEEHNRKVQDRKSFCSETFRILTKEGNTRWIAHMCEPVYDEEDRYIGRYVCNRDITDLKSQTRIIFKKENFVYRAYEDSLIGYYQIYFDGHLKTANDYFIKLLGYNSLKEFDQLNFEDYCVINLEKRKKFKNFLLRKDHVNDFISEWVKKDGTIIRLRETAYAVKNSDGSFTYYEGIVEDITRLNVLDSVTHDVSWEENKTKELKTEFLSLISKEIRTPLNIILDFVQVLKSNYLRMSSSDLNEYIGIIEKEGRRIQLTMELLLEMAELQRGTYDFNAVEVDLIHDIFLPICGNYQNEANQKNISFSFFNNLEKAKVIGDRHGLYQIFNQLTYNAMKYAMPGGKIAIKLFKDEDKTITVEIFDSSVGIKKKYVQLLFKAFSQKDFSYSKIFEGTGLRLAIVKKHCELNRASISVDSKKSKETKFTIKFKSELLDKRYIIQF